MHLFTKLFQYAINKHTFIHKKIIFFILNFDICVYIYSIRGEINQLSTNTSLYTELAVQQYLLLNGCCVCF